MSMSLPLTGHLLLLAVLLTLLAERLIKPLPARRIVVISLIILNIFISIGGLGAVQWLRSLFGDLSLLTWVVLAHILSQRLLGRELLRADSKKLLLAGTVLVGVVFYPLALGLGQFDPYQLGYAPQALGIVIFVVAAALWLRQHAALAITLLLPLLAFHTGWFESSNLWDYVLDPLLFGYAVVQLLAGYVRSFRLARNFSGS